ncbi:MAG: hypothetical protein RLZZ59_783, partial [Pseudomonadota bacterium]
IRTPDTLPYTRFPSGRLQPLGHLSITLDLRHYNRKLEEYQDLEAAALYILTVFS